MRQIFTHGFFYGPDITLICMLSLSAEMLQLPAHENPPRLSSNKCKTEVLAFWHFKVLIFELMLFSQSYS